MRVARNSLRIPPSHRANDGPLRTGSTQRQVSRINPFFIEDPCVSVVAPFHAHAQQSPRANQQRRHHVSNHPRTKDSHELEVQRLVVVDRTDKNQSLNSFGIVQRKGRSHSAAIRAANNRRASNSQTIQKSHYVSCLTINRVLAKTRFTRIPMTKHIQSNHTEAGLCAYLENFSPK